MGSCDRFRRLRGSPLEGCSRPWLRAHGAANLYACASIACLSLACGACSSGNSTSNPGGRDVDGAPQPTHNADAAAAESHDRERARFTEYVQQAIPILRDGRVTDWDRVNAVREWAYTQIPRAAPSAMLTLSERMPLQVRFLSFDEFRGGFACGGTAHILADVYQHLGYEAHTYDMGTRENGLSHMLTVVQIEHGRRKVLAVEDAYFNFTLSANDGADPADLRDVLALLAAGDVSSVAIESGVAGCKPAITRAENLEGDRSYHAQHYALGPPAVRNGMARYCHDFSLATFERLGEYISWIERQIRKRDLLYLFLFPLGTDGGSDIHEIAEEARTIQQRLTASQNR